MFLRLLGGGMFLRLQLEQPIEEKKKRILIILMDIKSFLEQNLTSYVDRDISQHFVKEEYENYIKSIISTEVESFDISIKLSDGNTANGTLYYKETPSSPIIEYRWEFSYNADKEEEAPTLSGENIINEEYDALVPSLAALFNIDYLKCPERNIVISYPTFKYVENLDTKKRTIEYFGKTRYEYYCNDGCSEIMEKDSAGNCFYHEVNGEIKIDKSKLTILRGDSNINLTDEQIASALGLSADDINFI